MKRQFIRLFFIALIPLLCLQTVLNRIFGEPYPTVRFPGFNSVPVASYPYAYTNTSIVLFYESDSIQMTLNELLEPTPHNAKAFFLSITKKLKQLPSYVEYHTTEERVKEVLDFIRDRAQQNSKFDALTKLELRWYRREVLTPHSASTSTLLEKRTFVYN